MGIKFVSAQLLDSEGQISASKRRELAIEADGLAANASTPEMQARYLELKRHWNTLADEIEVARETKITPLSRVSADSQ